MPKSSITQLVSAAKSELAYDDLLIGTIPGDANYKVNLQNFVSYLKNHSTALFPIKFNESYLNFNNASSSVSLINKNINEIETVTFDDNGCVVNITDKVSPADNRTDFYSGSISTADFRVSGNKGAGYFDKYFKLQANSERFITGPKIIYSSNLSTSTTSGGWELLFDKNYTNYKKSIVNYTHARLDKSGSKEPKCTYTFYIFWDGENNTRVSGVCNISSQNKRIYQNFIWQSQVCKDNTPVSPFKSFGTTTERTPWWLNMFIEVDGKNKKINKLPLKSIVPDSNRETHSMVVTIENFA